MPPEIVGEHLEPDRLYDAVNVLLSLQVIIKYAITHLFGYLFLVNKKNGCQFSCTRLCNY